MTNKKNVDLSEDRAWLDAYRRGEAAAQERVFRVYAPYVIVVLRGGVQTRSGTSVPGLAASADLEDVLHDVFLSALSEPTRNRYDGLRPYAPFIGQIARFKLVDHLRRVRRQPVNWAELHDTVLPMWTPQAPLPDEHVQTARDRERGRAFKATLSAAEVLFVQKRFEDGASQAATAEAIGSTRQRVRTLEGQIRTKFRAFLASWDKKPNPDPQPVRSDTQPPDAKEQIVG